MNQLIKNTNYPFSKFNYFLITILPITLLAGSLISNITIILIGIFFVIDLIQRKNFFLIKDYNFYFLIIINLYLIINSYFISVEPQSTIKAIGFFRFILLTYAIYFYFKIFDNSFLKVWAIIFLIVSFDIFYEFVIGKNILGFTSDYVGRIASFTGSELKIGGFYFGFLFISLAFFNNKKKTFFTLFFIFLILALLIGERSNFIKILIMYLLFLSFFLNISLIKRISIISSILIISLMIIFNIPNLKGKYSYLNIFSPINKIETTQSQNYLKQVIDNNRHFVHYQIALRIFEENIIFGKGFKSFRAESYNEKYFDQNLEFSIGHGATHPHQFHFEILSELGLIGYILVMTNFFYLIFRQKNLNKTFLNKSSILFLIASLVPILPSGSFFTSFGATIFFINYSFLIKSNIIDEKK